MARCEYAAWKPIPENTTEPVIAVKAIVFHTAVSAASSLYGYFSRSDVNVESHFYVQQNGGIEQYMDTSRQADAQFDGNAYAISVESWDNASVIPWTPTQLESNARLAAWAHRVHGVELVKAYKHPDGTIHGIGYHAQFTQEWNRDNHACPGAPRIAQMPALIARAVEIAQAQEDTLSAAEVDQINGYTRDLLIDGYTVNGVPHQGIGKVVEDNQKKIAALSSALASTTQRINDVADAQAEARQAVMELRQLVEALGGDISTSAAAAMREAIDNVEVTFAAKQATP